MTLRAVLFDWRGTLVMTPGPVPWMTQALSDLGLEHDAGVVSEHLARLERANGPDNRLDTPGMDTDAELYRRIFDEVMADAGFSGELADHLCALDASPAFNWFAEDVVETLEALRERDVRTAVVSDIHFDLRPHFQEAGLLDLVDHFALSYELGVQKPDPAMFLTATDALGVAPENALMVGDRSGPDGAAVEYGLTTLLMSRLASVDQRRLHRVVALVDAG